MQIVLTIAKMQIAEQNRCVLKKVDSEIALIHQMWWSSASHSSFQVAVPVGR